MAGRKRSKRKSRGTRSSSHRKTAGKTRSKSSSRSTGAARRRRDPADSDELAGELPESLRSTFDLQLPSDKLYYRIGEVAEITGVEDYVLRYWETEFKWMAPQKSRSGQRRYRPKDIELILLIQRLLHTERYTIAGARQRLRELGVTRALAEARSAEISAPRRTSELQAAVRNVRQQLEALRDELVAGS